MNKRSILFFLALSLCFISSAQSDQFYLKTSDRSSIEALRQNSLISEIYCPFRHEKMQNTYLLMLHQPFTLDSLLKSFGNSIVIEYLEEVPKVEIFYTPNDLLASQYALSIINATQAWDLNLDASNARIAVIDNAIDITHPDLANSIWINPGEIPNDGVDNDFNGFIDDVTGWDFADYDNNPNPPSAILDHGTHVAGIASSNTNNGSGVASIGMNAKLVPIKIGLDANGALVNTEQAIDYAISLGVDVINMSWGGSFYSQTAQNLFELAYLEGIVCVAAAGNASSNLPFYPAAYNRVISVGSTNALDQASYFTNYGPTVDLAAPGSDIYSLIPAAQYGNSSGTSMASPLVAGLVALMKDANPLATVDEIETCLLSTCVPITGPLSSQVGAGRIDAYEAMLCITQPTAEFTSDFTQICPGNSIQFYNYSLWPGTTFSWSFPGGIPAVSNLQNPVVSYPNGGNFDVTLTVSNGAFTQTNSVANYVNITQPSATISGTSTIVAGGFGSVTVNLNGIAPFSFTITDGINNYPITGVTNSPNLQFFSPSVTTDYTITNLSDSQCNGTSSGLGTIIVTPAGSLPCDSLTISFTKYLGTNINDMAAGVADLGQYGYLVMGRKQYSGTNIRTYLCRLDKCGNILWENLYDPVAYGIPTSAYMVGNEIYTMGYHGIDNASTRTMLMKLDLNGVVLDARRIAGPNNTTYPRFMIQADNGDHIIGMVTNSIPSIGGNDHYIVRAQGNGTILWQRRFGSNNNEFLHNIFEDNAGDILSCGQLIEGALRSGIISKFDANGNHLWSKKYNMGIGETYIMRVVELNGFYYAVGHTNEGTYGDVDGFVVKLDMDGNIVWSKKMGGTGYDDLQSIATYNNTLYLLGSSESGAPNQDVLLSRFDQLGNLIDFGSFGTPIDDLIAASGQQLEITSDGDWLGVATSNAGALGGTDIALFKLNDYMDLCQPSSLTIQSSSIALQALNFPITVQTPSWSFTPIAIPTEPIISNQGFACLIIPPCLVQPSFSSSTVTCINDSVQFTDLILPNSTADMNFWDFGDGNNSGFVPIGNISHLYSGPGAYLVEMIAIDTLLGCSDTITQTVVVASDPSIAIPDTLFGCLFDILQIDLTDNCLSPQASVVWSPDSIIQAVNSNNIVIEINYFGYVYVTIIDNGITMIDSVYIAESPNCCVSVAAIIPPASICQGQPIAFTQNSIINGNSTFLWSFLPDGNPLTWAGPNPPNVTFNSIGAKQVILNLNDNCGSKSDTLYFSVVASPIFDLGPDLNFCTNTVLQLGDSTIDDWNYLWQPGFAVSDSTISNPTTSIVGDQIITVQVTDPWTGCSSFDTLNISIDSIEIDLGNNLVFCEDTSIQFGLLAQPNFEYNWIPAGITSDPNSANPILNLTSSQSVIVFVTDTLLGCAGSDTVDVLIDEVLIDLGPDVVFCTETLYALGPNPIPTYNYLWEPASEMSDPTNPNPNYLITGNDTVSVAVTSTITGCISSDTVLFSIEPVYLNLLNEDTIVCEPLQLTVNTNHSGLTDIQWFPQSNVTSQTLNSANFSITENTIIYASTFSESGACSDIDSMMVTFGTIPEPIIIDTVLCDDETFSYSPIGTWLDGSQIISSISINEEGIYTYSENNACGTTIHEITIDLTSCDCDLYVPNSFTPDGDERNNTFSIVGDCKLIEFHLLIFNRWGELIFESFDKNVPWDGTYDNRPVQDGSYTWKISYKDSLNTNKLELVGHVNVLR